MGTSMALLKGSDMNLESSARFSPANGARSSADGLNPRATASSRRKRIWKLLKKKTDMEIAEIRLEGVQQKDTAAAPVIKPGLVNPFLHCPVKHLAHEYCH